MSPPVQRLSVHPEHRDRKAPSLLRALEEGKDVALISDAGSPGISDPGEELVAMCYEEGYNVSAIPGATASVVALTSSGQKTRRFSFEAFLPKDKKERRRVLEEMERETRTLVVYEAPHRLKETLKELYQALGNRSITICRELTKKFEEHRKTTLEEAMVYYEENDPRGEYVLIIAGKTKEEVAAEETARWEELSIEEHLQHYLDEGLDKKEAMKAVAKDRGVSKRDIYNALL